MQIVFIFWFIIIRVTVAQCYMHAYDVFCNLVYICTYVYRDT